MAGTTIDYGVERYRLLYCEFVLQVKNSMKCSRAHGTEELPGFMGVFCYTVDMLIAHSVG